MKVSAFWNMVQCRLIKMNKNLTKINMFKPHIIQTKESSYIIYYQHAYTVNDTSLHTKSSGVDLNHCQYNKRQI